MRRLWSLLTVIFIGGCNSQSLEDYALCISEASKPGKNIQEFVSSSQDLPPDQRLAAHYKFLLTNWKYKPDPKGLDQPQEADVLIKRNTLEGDCEDFSVMLVAICTALGITSQICLGKSKTGKSGHVWVEVPICNPEDLDPLLEACITREFDTAVSLITRDTLAVLQLSPYQSLNNYSVTHLIDTAGHLITITSAQHFSGSLIRTVDH